VVSQK